MEDDTTAGQEPAIRVDGLRKTFGSGESAVTAVDGVSLEIEAGSVVGLLGPNGAGKTTIIKSILGLILPDEGTIEITGTDFHDQPTKAYEKIGAILEGARNIYWRLTVRENLIYFAGLGGENPSDLRNRHDDLLEQFNIADRAGTTVNELSRGMKQKVSLASTLARDVDVVFMDEPTLGLDIEASLELRSEINQLAESEDATIVLCSHDMDVIQDVCDSVVILNDGRVVEHDQVETLLEIFNTRQYEITLDPPIPDDVREHVEALADATRTDARDNFVFTLTVTESGVIYEVMNVLEDADQEILDVESLDPDLEEVFLKITDAGPGNDSGPGTVATDRNDDSGPGDDDRSTREVTTDDD